MKKLLFSVICGIFVLGSMAFAGDYHFSSSLTCYECHVLHGQQQHGYNADGSGIYTPIGADAPYEYLLRNTINDLCLSCHDGQTFAPDVLEENTGTNVRLAGALNRDGAAPYYQADGHTLDMVATAPGGAWQTEQTGQNAGLNCTDCHHQHGYAGSGNPDPTKGQYRNVVYRPGDSTTSKWLNYALTTNELTRPVFERSASTNHYDLANVDFNEPDQTLSDYGAWCAGCHTNFHGKAGDPNMGGLTGVEWLRHPTANANIGAYSSGHSSKSTFAGRVNKVKVMTATENWNPNQSSQVTDHTPSCFSCHKAHGNQNAFGLIFMKGTGTITEEGDDGTLVKDLCKQCHVQG